MRIHHWFRTIAGALALTAAAESGHAQEYGVPGPGMAPPPGYGPMNPGTMYPQGVPQGFDPWPQISPFGNGNLDQDQYRNSRGLWFEELLYKHRDFYAGVDAIYGFSKGEGNTLIGAPTVPLDPITNGPVGYTPPPDPTSGLPGSGGPNGTTGGAGPGPSTVLVARGVYPYVVMQPAPGTPPLLFTEQNDVFPIRNHNILGNVQNAGVGVRWGFDDADGMGLMMSGFYLGENNQVFQMGTDVINGVPVTPAMVTATGGQILLTKNGALPTNNGLDPNIPGWVGPIGSTQKYDIMFRVERRQEAAGAGLAYYMSPLFKSSGAMLRPFVGGRYMYLNESFGFTGVDSGFGYEIEGITGTTGGTNTQPTFRPDPATLFQSYDQFTATLNSSVQTHLAGPEVGLRYDLGTGDGFKVWGATTAGLMANSSKLTLNGNNIGEVENTRFDYGINMLEEDARFSSKANHGRVSALFEQTIAIDSRIFEALPFTNEVPVLNTAIFHFGYTFTAIGAVNRPLDVVNWNGFPLTPTLNDNTQTFVLHRFNFGLEWKY